MKIGILTYHRAENYGALLQAYALSTFLRKLGHDISFIDYWPEYHVEHYRVFSKKRFQRLSLLGKIRYILMAPLWASPRLLRKWRLENFMHKHLYIGKHICYQRDDQKTDRYDLAIYGSDQIWRRQNIKNNDYNPWYFGSSNVLAKKKIAYAASMGVIDADEQEKQMIKEWLGSFDHLSVREQDLRDFIEHLGYSAHLVIDPTFLINREDWRKLFRQSSKGKYILFYNLLHSEESVKFTNSLSRKTGLPVKEINMKLQFSHLISNRYIACASIEQFLQLVNGAEYVVSNSFHGVALSLIFEKQFWAIGFGEKANRVLSLLGILGLSDRYVEGKYSDTLFSLDIDYVNVSTKLLKVVNDSKNYLKQHIG